MAKRSKAGSFLPSPIETDSREATDPGGTHPADRTLNGQLRDARHIPKSAAVRTAGPMRFLTNPLAHVALIGSAAYLE